MDVNNNEKRRKLVLFGSQITVGGAQRVLLDQAQWFMDHGTDVLAVFFYDKDGLLDQWQQTHGFPVRALSQYRRGGSKMKNLAGVVRGFFRLIVLLRNEKPDAVECFTHDADLLGLPAAWLSGVPCRVGTHHGQFVGLGLLKEKLHTLVINSPICSRLVCVSERARNQALSEGVRPGKIETIFNGVVPVKTDPQVREAVRAELGLRQDEWMVLNVGRLVPEKAQLQLVRAAVGILEEHSNYRFFIAGEGPEREALTAEIDRLGVRDHFKLLGNRDDVSRLLNGADLFVLCSKTEGMPVSLMEAMSAGVPAVCSDLEGIVQLMGSDGCGALVPVGDHEKLAEAILEQTTDPEQMKQSGECGKTRILEHFSIDASCEAYRRLFGI